MHTIRTKSFHQYDHPEFEMLVDLTKVGKDYIPPFINHLQDCVANGTTFTPGTLIQYGFNAIQVTQGDGEYLRLDEPNNKGLPITFRPGITDSLLTANSQILFLESYGIDIEELNTPAMLDSCFVCGNFKTSPNLAMSRLSPIDEEDSGWFVGCLDEKCDHDNVDNLTRISLYETTCAHPHIKPWLGFPLDSIILLEEENIEVTINDEVFEIQPDSPLAKGVN